MAKIFKITYDNENGETEVDVITANSEDDLRGMINYDIKTIRDCGKYRGQSSYEKIRREILGSK